MLGKDYFQGKMIKHSISVHEMLQDDASLVYRTPTSRSYVIYDMLNSQRSRQNMVSWRRLLLIASTVFVWTDHNRHLPSLPSSSKINSSSFSMPQIFPPGFFQPTVGSSQISVIWPSISTTKAQQLGVSSASTCVPLSNDVTLGFECHDGILLFAWFVKIVSAGQGTKPWSAWMECKQVSSRGKKKEWICTVVKLDKDDENWIKFIRKWNFHSVY